jgi:catechol-2,3-dioxygenase
MVSEGECLMTAKVQFGHMALPAQDPAAQAAFYQRLLGLKLRLQGTLPQLGDFVFLSDSTDNDRPLTLAFTTRAEARHMAWEVESLAALRDFYINARAQDAQILYALDHGVTLSLYLRDPEGNNVEVYWLTGRGADEPYADPVDLALLEQPEEALLAQLNARARS